MVPLVEGRDRRRIKDEPARRSDRLPTWLTELDSTVASAVRITEHVLGDGENITIELTLPDGKALSVGDPHRWSPVAVEIFLTNWAPRKLMIPVEDRRRLPDVLGAFIAYAHRIKGIAPELTTETIDAVDRWLPEFVDQIDSDDDPELVEGPDTIWVAGRFRFRPGESRADHSGGVRRSLQEAPR